MTWAPDYATVTDLADYLRISDQQDDVQLALAVTAASRAVDNATNRQFGLSAALEDRYYSPSYDDCERRYVIEIDDLVVVTGLAVTADTTGDGTYDSTITDYSLKPVNALANGKPYTKLWVGMSSSVLPNAYFTDSVKVTARWGWTSVPTTVQQATLIQASRFFSRREAPFGVAGSPESGSEMRLLERADPDVALMLRSYYRWWGAR